MYSSVRLEEVLTQNTEYIDAPEPRSYPKLSVKLYGKGVVLDEPVDGATLRMQRHQLAKAGQVILSEIWGKKGAIGFVPPEGEGALCTSHFFLFDVRTDRLLPRYLHYIFISNYLEPQLNKEAKGTTGYAAVRPKHLLAAEIPLPPLDEQRRIVAHLDALAEQIVAARGLRQSAVDEAIQFLNSELNAIADLMPINGTLFDAIQALPRNGWSPKCDNSDDGVAVLTLSAITGFRYRDNQYKTTSEPTSTGAHYWLAEGDILISRANTPELVGHAAIYSGIPKPCVYPDLMMRFRAKEALFDSGFIVYWLQSKRVRDYIKRNSKGTSPTMKKISQGIVANIPFSIIGIEEQRHIVAYLDGLQAEVDRLKRLQAETAAELDTLLPSLLDRAFRGEL